MNNDAYGSGFSRLGNWLLKIPLLRGMIGASRRFCELSCQSAPQDGNTIFLTVHGTWSRDAAWTRDDESCLLPKLKAEWPCAGYYSFKWSGVNGTRARIVAGSILAEGLNVLKADNPRCNIVVVSHSHGGNVVAWAATDLCAPLAAAIYVNTPFIHVKEQLNPSSRFLKFFLLVAPFLSLCSVGELSKLCPKLTLDTVFERITPLKLLSLSLLAGALLLLLLKDKVNDARGQLARLSKGPRNVNKEFVLSVLGDEALGMLSSVSFGQWAALRTAVGLYLLVTFIFLTARAFKLLPEQLTSRYSAISLLICFGILLSSVAFGILGQGVIQTLVGLDSLTAVTSAPVGAPDYASIGWLKPSSGCKPAKRAKLWILRHSIAMQDSESIAKIIDWLKNSKVCS